MKKKSGGIVWADIVGKKRYGIIGAIARMLLFPLGKLYATVAILRNIMYDKGVFAVKSADITVVSVGNIVVGGTGKTPVTLLLAKALKDHNIAIVSRGYKSPAEKASAPQVLSYGDGPQYSARQCGDEAYLLAKNADNAIVVVGKDRHRAAKMAAKAGADVVILDDGMQYRRLARDVEVVVMDGNDLFGKGHCIPRGFLREPLWGLERADVIVVNNIVDERHYNDAYKALHRYTVAPIIGVTPRHAGVYALDGERIEDIKGKKVGIFCGIAKPEYFRRQVELQGADVVDELFVTDHVAIDIKAIIRFAEECKNKGCDLVLCTEKDSVKMPKSIPSPLQIALMRIELDVVAGKEEWQHSIENIAKKIVARQQCRETTKES